ncbi:MAG: sigma-70 family RNA polymerase sigma factor [Candidatus Korobacteraceae bacterium]|jgi:RNA polymerase sigma-70 factor, ECF subfamily
MSLSIGEAKNVGFAEYLPAILQSRVESYRKIYELNRHRVYSLAFWMTDNELAAEELMIHSFRRAFLGNEAPTANDIDGALIAELRQYMPLGTLTLDCAACDRVVSVRRNTLRVELERAVVQLPGTEKMIFLMHDVEGYDHARIAHLLGVTEDDSCRAVHQARLRLRELLSKEKE